MAGGQDQRVAGHGVGHPPLVYLNFRELFPGQGQAAESVAEAHLPAQGLDLLPQVGHHLAEQVCAHMGLVLPEDVLRRSGGDEGLHHVGQAGVMGAGGELAVGEGPGTALAKLDVGLRV